MKMSMLTLPILTLHFLVDKGEKYPVDDVYEQIEDGTIFTKIAKKYSEKYQDIRMDGVKLNAVTFPADEKVLIQSLQGYANASLPETFGIDDRSNGLLFLAGILNEMIQASIDEVTLR